MFALIFLVENSFYYESATELSSDFKTGQHKMENSSSDPAKKKNCVGWFLLLTRQCQDKDRHKQFLAPLKKFVCQDGCKFSVCCHRVLPPSIQPAISLVSDCQEG